MQHWATWRTPCVVHTPSKMLSYSGEPAKRGRPSQCPENGTREEAKGRRGNKCWNLDAVQEAARNECLAGLYQPRDTYFQGVRCRPQLSEDPLDVPLGRTALSIRSLATVSCRATLTSTENQPQGRLERLQSQSQLPATSNPQAQSPGLCPPRGEQSWHQQGASFRCWSGRPTELPVICKAQLHGTPKQPWWKASWRYDQRFQIITRESARSKALCGNIERHVGVEQVYESYHDGYIR